MVNELDARGHDLHALLEKAAAPLCCKGLYGSWIYGGSVYGGCLKDVYPLVSWIIHQLSRGFTCKGRIGLPTMFV